MLLSRRQFALSAAVAPLLKAAAPARLKIVVTGGHPGDPECGCAGTIARYTKLGHEVTLLYMNRGEGYCKDGGNCGEIRTAEAQKACEILKAKAVFNDQIDGQAIVDGAHYASFQKLLNAQNPDIVFTQWPIDSHPDHRALSMLVLDTWLKSGRKFALYYYEVADDTLMFQPTEFVDISDPQVEEIRHQACYAHASQLPDKWYPAQVAITRFRGSVSGYAQADGFLRHWQSKIGFLP